LVGKYWAREREAQKAKREVFGEGGSNACKGLKVYIGSAFKGKQL